MDDKHCGQLILRKIRKIGAISIRLNAPNSIYAGVLLQTLLGELTAPPTLYLYLRGLFLILFHQERCTQDRRPRPVVSAKAVRNQMVPSHAE